MTRPKRIYPRKGKVASSPFILPYVEVSSGEIVGLQTKLHVSMADPVIAKVMALIPTGGGIFLKESDFNPEAVSPAMRSAKRFALRVKTIASNRYRGYVRFHLRDEVRYGEVGTFIWAERERAK